MRHRIGPILSSYKPDVRRNREECHEDTSPMSPTKLQQTTRDCESRNPKAYDYFCLVVGALATPSSHLTNNNILRLMSEFTTCY